MICADPSLQVNCQIEPWRQSSFNRRHRTETGLDLNREAMLTPEIVAHTILQSVLLPKEAVIENLTVTPSLGAL